MTRTYHKAEDHSAAILDMWDRRKLNITQIARTLDMDRATVRTHLRKHSRLAPKGEENSGIADMVANAIRTMPSEPNKVVDLSILDAKQRMGDETPDNMVFVVDGMMPAAVFEDGRPAPDRVGLGLAFVAGLLAIIVCALMWNAVN